MLRWRCIFKNPRKVIYTQVSLVNSENRKWIYAQMALVILENTGKDTFSGSSKRRDNVTLSTVLRGKKEFKRDSVVSLEFYKSGIYHWVDLELS